MDIISFFRDIDGILYYIVLVVNTILIFAIIGYLGEKNNQKLIKMSLNTPVPTTSGGLDFSASPTVKHSDANIPTVAPTTIENNQVGQTNVNMANQTVPLFQNNQQVVGTISNSSQNTNNQPGMYANNGDNPPVINNEIDPNEKAPAVLVINSDNTNMPK